MITPAIGKPIVFKWGSEYVGMFKDDEVRVGRAFPEQGHGWVIAVTGPEGAFPLHFLMEDNAHVKVFEEHAEAIDYAEEAIA